MLIFIAIHRATQIDQIQSAVFTKHQIIRFQITIVYRWFLVMKIYKYFCNLYSIFDNLFYGKSFPASYIFTQRFSFYIFHNKITFLIIFYIIYHLWKRWMRQLQKHSGFISAGNRDFFYRPQYSQFQVSGKIDFPTTAFSKRLQNTITPF